MLKIFKELYYKNVDSEEITELITIINEETSEFNTFLLFNLEVINESIEQLSESKKKLIELSAVRQLVGTFHLAKKLEAIFNERTEEVKITKSEFESYKMNIKAIINGIEKVAELQKKNMMEIDPSFLFIYLTT